MSEVMSSEPMAQTKPEGPVTVEGNYVIRSFRREDVNAFIELGGWLVKHSRYKSTVTLDVEKVVLLFMKILTDPDYFGVYVETGDAEPVGAVIGVIQPYYMGLERYASDMGVGLLPEYRKDSEKLLSRMLARYEAWAQASDAQEILVSTSTGAHGPRYQKFVEALGYDVVGFNARRRIK